MVQLSQKQIRSFQKKMLSHYKKHGRDLPWRRTQAPYRILVSEVMLQQTQVSRVIEKYKCFLKAFPNWKALAEAKQSEVIRIWQGLGYNRRALSLHRTAQKVVGEHGGKLPHDKEALKKLPGIGEATASSIRTFAFDVQEVFIETNIRSVFIHFFFRNKKGVHDKDIIPLIGQTLPEKNARAWYFALMDYGVKLKKEENPSRRSAHHTKQKPFKTSDRYIRGALITLLTKNKRRTLAQLQKGIERDNVRIKKCLKDLEGEGFVKKVKESYCLV